jgi:MFS family permease
MVMTATAVTGSAIFTFMVNGNMQILGNGFKGQIENPAVLGTLLAIIYMVASFAQILVGNWIDRFSMKRLQLWIALVQIPLLVFIAYADGWILFIALLVGMAFVFGSIPFNDTMIIRYVDDQIRSRVAGMRYTVSFAISSLAVWLLGPMVKDKGFLFLLLMMAVIALIRVVFILQLPDDSNYHKASQSQ